MIGLTIQPAPGEIDRVSETIQKWAGKMRVDMQEATLQAASFIAYSAGGATVKSKKWRKVIKNPLRGQVTNKGKRWWSKFVAIREYAGGVTASGVTAQSIAYIPIDQESKRIANKSTAAFIRRSGLAKSSWMWMVGAMRRNASSDLGLRQKAGTLVSVRQGNDPQNPTVTMNNKLKYVAFALKSDSIDGIMSKGMRNMERLLEKRAKIALERAA